MDFLSDFTPQKMSDRNRFRRLMINWEAGLQSSLIALCPCVLSQKIVYLGQQVTPKHCFGVLLFWWRGQLAYGLSHHTLVSKLSAVDSEKFCLCNASR